MKIITLIENTPGAEGCAYEHGLSIYIETGKHKILLDTGATQAFGDNARKLGVDLDKVDMVVLSHGHYDHAGGIMKFTEYNTHAKIYLRPSAVKSFYHFTEKGARYIGIDKEIVNLPQVVYTKEWELLDEDKEYIALFSDVRGRRMWPQGNLALKCLVNESYEQDLFDHEQCLVIRENQKTVLICGCAHNGILNILDKYQAIFGTYPDRVISGFHMKKNTPLTEEERRVVIETAEELCRLKDVKFYSGHCTGEEAFAIMKDIMKEQLVALHSGEVVLNE